MTKAPMKLLMCLALVLPVTAPAQTPGADPASPTSATPTRQDQAPTGDQAAPATNEEAKAIERSIDERTIERTIEGTIDRVAAQVNPNEWRQPAMLGILLAIISTVTFFAVVAMVSWLLYRRSKERLQARVDMHTQLLGKFTSGAEFSAFISSSNGKEFVERLWTPKEHVHDRVIRATRVGLIAVTLGLGFLTLSLVQGFGVAPGILSVAVGVGYLISAAASHRMSETLGVGHGDTGIDATRSSTDS